MWAEDHRAAVAAALLRVALIPLIFASEQLIETRALTGRAFLGVLALAGLTGVAGLVALVREPRWGPALRRLQPGIDILLLAGLAYTSGGAYSDVRKAFFVIPLAAAFSERPRSTASWSAVAVVAFSVQAALAAGHPAGAHNSWQRLTLNQDIYLAWTGAAATLLAAGLALRSRHTAELAESRRYLLTQSLATVERERTRLADALHDYPVQNLIAARHDLRRAEANGDPAAFSRLHEAIDLTVAQLREEIFHLHPHVLDQVGLSAALEQVAHRFASDRGPGVTIEIDPAAAEAHRDTLFAIGRELLANAFKHAGAKEIVLTVSDGADGVTLKVSDDGQGIAPGRLHEALLSGHIGLAAVRERVASLDGKLGIRTEPTRGTTVSVQLPAGSRGPAGRDAKMFDGVSDQVSPSDTLGLSTA